MAKKANPRAVRAAVKAAGIDTPYWFRVVGNRLEVQPVGGKVVVFPFPLGKDPQPAAPPDARDLPPAPEIDLTITITGELDEMKRDELRALARRMEIPRQGSMTKAQLIEAIEAWTISFHTSQGD